MFSKELEDRQVFWQTQKKKFEKEYMFSSHFDFLSFDLDHGNYVLKHFIDKEMRLEALDAFHRVNTGWTMWKKAIQIKQEDLNELKCLPEGCVVVSIEQAKDSERLEFLLNNPTLETSILTRESCVGIMSRFLLVYEIINKFINKKSAKPCTKALRDAIDKAMNVHN
ncbi:hypothetical protein [Acinetobacter pittii]|uniref:hypothetical protein n=1 Tax=Acinetobacter pittii TaxID=48296 RepID=UPI00102F2B58|nr:hypothetical protein [Acinetobacter pittii]MDV7706553.1 hypothetical protein [Acinetobacter pittii]MDV7761431.1 hypothetical protein [Acinetobacter pittii]RZG94353.1 hypothetical protein EXE03_15845 [Acinetobacter pittii]